MQYDILIASYRIIWQLFQQVIHVVVVDLNIGHKHGVVVVLVNAITDVGVDDSVPFLTVASPTITTMSLHGKVNSLAVDCNINLGKFLLLLPLNTQCDS